MKTKVSVKGLENESIGIPGNKTFLSAADMNLIKAPVLGTVQRVQLTEAFAKLAIPHIKKKKIPFLRVGEGAFGERWNRNFSQRRFLKQEIIEFFFFGGHYF